MLTYISLQKEIEVSHWGNLAIEERFWIQSDGAILKGDFSRYDYQRNPSGTPTAIPSLSILLPPGASDFYFRDDIGNISTSSYIVNDDGVELILEPRYVLLGGWKATFYIGYNLPLSNFLEKDASDHNWNKLSTEISSSVKNAVIDTLVTTVILPEGSK